MSAIEEGEAFIRHYFDQLYDPVKAHEYYEDHKKLKGREPGKTDDSSGKRSSGSPKSGTQSKAAVQETAAQRKAKLDAEVAALKARLEALRELLRQLVAEAKRRGGIETKPEGDAKTSDSKPEKELTPAEKEEQAQKAHEYYEKTKGTLPSQETTHVLKQKIALIEKKIAEMREKLASLPQLVTTQVEESPSPSGPENITQVRKGDSQNGS